MSDPVPRYCVDTNVLIQSKNGPYGFDIAPSFWNWLDRLVAKKTLFCTWEVYRELNAKEDELARWSRDREDSGMFIKPDERVMEKFTEISDYVNERYESNKVNIFLDGADPWVIAHAKTSSCIVVSHETRVNDKSFKIKIPNVCGHFGVPIINVYEMLREAQISL